MALVLWGGEATIASVGVTVGHRSGGSGGSGIALVLLILIAGGALWAFRRTTSSGDRETPLSTPEPGFEPAAALRVVVGSLVGASLLGLVLPVLASDFGDSGRLSDAGGETVIYFVVA